MSNKIDFVCKAFADLSIDELYEIMRLRQEVFVVEQDCPYLDADGKDKESIHVMAIINGKMEGYARVLPLGVSYEEYASIGRVISSSKYRKSGLGKAVMIKSIEIARAFCEVAPVKISSQRYARGFYSNLGFEEVGDVYLEDGIPHVAMILKLDSG